MTFAPAEPPDADAADSPQLARGARGAGDELRVRKTLRGTQSSIHIGRGAGTAAWQPASQAQLQRELAACGIQTEVVDRCARRLCVPSALQPLGGAACW